MIFPFREKRQLPEEPPQLLRSRRGADPERRRRALVGRVGFANEDVLHACGLEHVTKREELCFGRCGEDHRVRIGRQDHPADRLTRSMGELGG
jgi:hypothetical protein